MRYFNKPIIHIMILIGIVQNIFAVLPEEIGWNKEEKGIMLTPNMMLTFKQYSLKAEKYCDVAESKYKIVQLDKPRFDIKPVGLNYLPDFHKADRVYFILDISSGKIETKHYKKFERGNTVFTPEDVYNEFLKIEQTNKAVLFKQGNRYVICNLLDSRNGAKFDKNTSNNITTAMANLLLGGINSLSVTRRSVPGTVGDRTESYTVKSEEKHFKYSDLGIITYKQKLNSGHEELPSIIALSHWTGLSLERLGHKGYKTIDSPDQVNLTIDLAAANLNRKNKIKPVNRLRDSSYFTKPHEYLLVNFVNGKITRVKIKEEFSKELSGENNELKIGRVFLNEIYDKLHGLHAVYVLIDKKPYFVTFIDKDWRDYNRFRNTVDMTNPKLDESIIGKLGIYKRMVTVDSKTTIGSEKLRVHDLLFSETKDFVAQDILKNLVKYQEKDAFKIIEFGNHISEFKFNKTLTKGKTKKTKNIAAYNTDSEHYKKNNTYYLARLNTREVSFFDLKTNSLDEFEKEVEKIVSRDFDKVNELKDSRQLVAIIIVENYTPKFVGFYDFNINQNSKKFIYYNGNK